METEYLNFYATRPWAYSSVELPKAPRGRPKFWDTQEDIDFCLYDCPFADEECTGNVIMCKKLAGKERKIPQNVVPPLEEPPKVGDGFKRLPNRKFAPAGDDATHKWNGYKFVPLAR